MTPDELLVVVILIIGYPVIYLAGGFSLFFPTIRKYLRRHDIEDYRKNDRKWKWFYLNKVGILPWNLLLPYWGFALGLLLAEVFAIVYILTDLLVFRILLTIFFCIFVFSLFYQIDIEKRKRNKK